MLENAEQQSKRLAYAAHFLLSACWEPASETDRKSRLKQTLVHVENNFKDFPVEQLDAEAGQRLQKAGCPTPFHWPLEFPEVMVQRNGFDACVGNPPFLGGARISGTLGDAYVAYLLSTHSESNGNADLCSFFLRRICTLLQSGGVGGVVTTINCKGREHVLVGLTTCFGRCATRCSRG